MAARRSTKSGALAAFHPAVAAWFEGALGAPTRAQTLAWPEIAEGQHTLLLAPTGSGKTLAAFLWAIDRLVREPGGLRVLYISPLKALAVDVERNLRAPLAGVALAAERLGCTLHTPRVAVRTGDTDASERARIVRTPPDILITTPESLYLLLTSQQREILRDVDTVIVDEIHHLAPSKRGAHLMLSLERLVELREGKPLQRIGLSATQKPLAEIARLLGGMTPGTSPRRSEVPVCSPAHRPVRVVDASAKKTLSIRVEVPPPLDAEAVATLSERTGMTVEAQSVWPQVHVQLVRRIREARSTMIFVNSRRLAERMATALNEVAGEEVARAHHGSVARETRQHLEERLKSGDLPAIVATSSLELGIDMGAVDQVIQIEAPPSVASGIQRIGRASHHVGGVPAGILVPKHKHDLLACAAAAAGIEQGDVEETYYPRNPLDVLAQQIVAIVATGPLPEARTKSVEVLPTEVEHVWDLVRRAAPFAELPRSSFESVLDMLSGRYPSDEFADLRPKLTWDRTRGLLLPRPSAKRLALQNAGTIPDRGLYGVFLYDGDEQTDSTRSKTSRRVGELDEEMVFELSEGEVFLLGASSWRAERITRDRVLVTPAAGIPGKMPFWHGDRAGRSKKFGERVGALVHALSTLPRKRASKLLAEEHHLDARSCDDLLDYVHEQKRVASVVPSADTLVVERVPDELGDLRICVLSPFGTRVHAPWAMAALRRLREARAGDIEAVVGDDGIVFRVPGGEAPPPLDLLFPAADEIEQLVTRELGQSSLFAARFREASARALLLPRHAAGKRTPLWAQRKRAADLLAVAQEYPAFPIVLETYRECLRDAFDLPGLIEVLRGVETRTLRVVEVDLDVPSPMASSLMFSFVGNFLYNQDAPAAERRAQALRIDHAQLRELLGETELRELFDADVILEHARALQRRLHPLRHADAVHDLLLWLGDLTTDEVQSRVAQGELAEPWLLQLHAARRLARVRIAGEERWVAAEDAARYRDALGVVLEPGLPAALLTPTREPLRTLIARYARTHGPFTVTEIAMRFGLGESSVLTVTGALVAHGTLATGAFLPMALGGARGAVEYCDVEVLRALKQKTLSVLRKAIEPVSSQAFARFLLEWQRVDGIPLQSARIVEGREDDAALDELLRVVTQLEGAPLPASVLEREILPARMPGYQSWMLDQLLTSGELVWAGIEPYGTHDGRVALYRTDREALLAREHTAREGELHGRIRAHLERRGAVFFAELARALGGYPAELKDALWDLVWAGEVRSDTFEALRSLRASQRAASSTRRGRPVARTFRAGPPGTEGRWSLRRPEDVSESNDSPSTLERAMAQANALLERYGVVLREAAHVEGIAGGFSSVYDVFRALEERGRVRRGYFVAERGATQFALPGAADRLRLTSDAEPRVIVLAATDPASPWGALWPWPRSEGTAQRVPGARVILVDGELVGWLGRGGQALLTFFADSPERTQHAERLAEVLAKMTHDRGQRTVLASIDGVPARESAFAHVLQRHGFVSRGELLVHRHA